MLPNTEVTAITIIIISHVLYLMYITSIIIKNVLKCDVGNNPPTFPSMCWGNMTPNMVVVGI